MHNFHKMLTENAIVSEFAMGELRSSICVLILAALVNKTIPSRPHTCTCRIPLWTLAVFLLSSGCSSGPELCGQESKLRSSSSIVQLRWGGSWGASRPDGISNPSSGLWVWHSVPRHSAQTTEFVEIETKSYRSARSTSAFVGKSCSCLNCSIFIWQISLCIG